MSPTVEFGSKSAADAVREEYADHLCPDDDRRLKTVRFRSDAPGDVLERVELEAAESLDERSSGPGQLDLTRHERDRIDFSQGRANVPWARSIKGIAKDEGVDDWLAYLDPTLTVDEHREVMQRAGQEGGGKRMDAEDSATERAGRAARSAQSSECDHARGHCENGDPDACEFLTDTCGFDEKEVQTLLSEFDDGEDLVTVGGDGRFDEMQVTPEQAGALKKSFRAYGHAVSLLHESIDDYLRPEWQNAQQAAKAINSIRESAGKDPIHWEELEEIQAKLLDLTRKAAADCHECHADHSDHDHPVTSGDREDIREFVDEGRGATPVGSGGDHGEDPHEDVVEFDDQRDLGGDRVDDQGRLAGGERGERGQGEVEEHVEENPGGMMADERGETRSDGSTEQRVPDEFQVAEGGQHTL